MAGRWSSAAGTCASCRSRPGPRTWSTARLLLAHLPDPAATAASWATQLTTGGLLVLDEIEWIRADDPVLRAHLRLAEAMVATGGARMNAGPLLGGLADAPGLRRRLTQVAELPVPTARAATMFSMNLTAWGDKPVELGLVGHSELAELRAGMAERLESPAEGQITWGMHQAAYSRAD